MGGNGVSPEVEATYNSIVNNGPEGNMANDSIINQYMLEHALASQTPVAMNEYGGMMGQGIKPVSERVAGPPYNAILNSTQAAEAGLPGALSPQAQTGFSTAVSPSMQAPQAQGPPPGPQEMDYRAKATMLGSHQPQVTSSQAAQVPVQAASQISGVDDYAAASGIMQQPAEMATPPAGMSGGMKDAMMMGAMYGLSSILSPQDKKLYVAPPTGPVTGGQFGGVVRG